MDAERTLPAQHTVLLYSSQDDFVGTLAPFVAAGVEAGEGVIAAALPENLRALREALGPTPPSVRFVDAAHWYSRPPDTMGRWMSFVDDQLAMGRPGVRVIGEVFWPKDPLVHREMRRFESAATVGFEGTPSLVVCPYSKTRYPSSVIDAALAGHPGVIEDGVASLSPTFVPREQIVTDTVPELREPEYPEHEETQSFEPFEVVSAAEYVERRARRAGLEEHRVQNLVAAASEVTANAFAHAGSPVHLRIWHEGADFVCQIEDEGTGFEEPAVGYQPPDAEDDRWGLWLVRRRTDLVEVGRGRRGTVVRLRVAPALYTRP
jgi:anti-sigma regulatory factor (Ser/Thr protein kinase)